ncbi:MAG: glycosyltransferase [Clostridia bacterium]|nr:glycosyltransferase [Clostridia bacterium]
MNNKIVNSFLGKPYSALMRWFLNAEHAFFNLKWKLSGGKLPSEDDVKLMRENVTFVFKSFERQKSAKRLYANIRRYYPDVKVIIADDSKTPLDLKGDNLEVIHLPFNSGLSFGLNKALERVTTPYVVRMDDDEVLTPFTNFHKHLRFLMQHEEIDLSAVSYVTTPRCRNHKVISKRYLAQSMDIAPKPLKIPHLTKIDDEHTVVGKPPNIFIARTDAVKSVGYDDNIRMLDHNEFFFRAAGNKVSVFSPDSFVFHIHDVTDKNYLNYRSDFRADQEYIKAKMTLILKNKENK